MLYQCKVCPLQTHVFGKDRERESANGISSDTQLAAKVSQQTRCCAGKTRGTSALLLLDICWAFLTPSIQPELWRHGHPTLTGCGTTDPSVSPPLFVFCLLLCLYLELPCGIVSSSLFPALLTQGLDVGSSVLLKAQIKALDLQTATWSCRGAAQAGLVVQGIRWGSASKPACFTSDCYPWMLRALEYKSWTAGDKITSSHTLIYIHVYSSVSFFGDNYIYLFSHVTRDINSLAAVAAKGMIQFTGPVKNDLLHYLR